MKRKFNKLIACTLVFLICLTCLPSSIVHGEDGGKIEKAEDGSAGSEKGLGEENQEILQPAQDGEGTSVEGKKETPPVAGSDEGNLDPANSDEENLDAGNSDVALNQDEKKEEKDQSLLKYLYIESPYLETPNKQSIVVSWGDGTENIQGMQLIVKAPNGEMQEWSADSQSENAYLFSRSFEPADKGIYQVWAIHYVQDGAEHTYNLNDDLQVSAFFGVDEEYIGEKSEHTQIEQQNVEEYEDATAQTFEGQSDEGIADVVGEVLESAGADAADATITPSSRLARGNSSGLVVVLDPGHDIKHAGAESNGIREHIANLAIAKACKAELEKYAGVTVYLTRETEACPFPGSSSNIDDINRRAAWAKTKGADVFISFHLNASPSAGPKGAEVYYSPASGASVSGKPLASSIQSQLVALGLKDRGVKQSDSYAVCNASKRNGFPGLIIEHAFVTNTSDVSNFLATGLKRLGIADAKGIVSHYGLEKKGSGKWVQDDNGWKFQLSDGSYVSRSWYEVDGGRYYFNSSGYRVTGLVYVGAGQYYFDDSGVMQKKCWITYDGAKMFLASNGLVVRGWAYVGADRYYFSNSTGKMVTGLVYVGASRYYFDDYGVMLKKTWINHEGERFFLTSSGAAVTGLAYVGADRYYFDDGGVMQKKSWITYDGSKMFAGSNGIMVKGWANIGSGRYYFSNSNNRMITGLVYVGASRYYFNSNGVMQKKRWIDLGESRYYLGSNGVVVKGWAYVGAERYYFAASSGRMIRGWAYVGADRYYFGTTGVMSTGWVKISNVWHSFNNDGTYTGKTSPHNPLQPTAPTGYLIQGKSSVSVKQMAQYYNNYGRSYPSYYNQSTDVKTIEQLCQVYYEEAASEGIRAEVAFAQAMKETGWLKFGGVVRIEQNNFAGIGAVNNSANGASFSSVRLGVRAQIQHLKAYGTTAPLNNKCVDPRFDLVTRGSAIYVEYLGINENPNGLGWATGANYGYDIVNMINNMKSM